MRRQDPYQDRQAFSLRILPSTTRMRQVPLRPVYDYVDSSSTLWMRQVPRCRISFFLNVYNYADSPSITTSGALRYVNFNYRHKNWNRQVRRPQVPRHLWENREHQVPLPQTVTVLWIRQVPFPDR
ncbi:hypothetical protein TRIUR3_12063 [Triticum urartu]|uniref:Uncharacterized protein n=1 Tax=Triticum urartu TaxID=4572 RepID=M7ZBL1_TRIUA|nr:hypothetical protein TRIUR3_12063 [Triticum urartu]